MHQVILTRVKYMTSHRELIGGVHFGHRTLRIQFYDN
jgi:hypothetical protein